MAKNKILDPLNDYQLIEISGEDTGSTSLYIANVDGFGVEGTPILENSAKPYITNEETGEPGVVTGEPLNAVPRGDLDKQVYDNTSDVYYHPEYTYPSDEATSGATGE